MQMSIEYKTQRRRYSLQGSAKKISKSLARYKSRVPALRKIHQSSGMKESALTMIGKFMVPSCAVRELYRLT